MKEQKISFIGGGNMAEAIIAGLVRSGHEAEKIYVADPQSSRLQLLQQKYGVQTCQDRLDLMQAEVVVLAVKPQQIKAALQDFRDMFRADQTLVSIAAGVTLSQLRDMAGEQVQLVRVMPNTPALVGAGVSALFSEQAGAHQQRAEYLLRACGQTLWVEREKDLHAVTAVSGSGPAYFFLLAELIQGAGQTLGLTPEVAAKLANHTALGAGKMLVESGRTASELRQQVTSPGGTTQAALDVMFEEGLPEVVRNAVAAAARRSAELGR